MTKRLRKIATSCAIGALLFSGQSRITYAAEIPITEIPIVEIPTAGIPIAEIPIAGIPTVGIAKAGTDVVLSEYFQNNSDEKADITENVTSEYENIAIASVTNYVNIRSKANENSKILGKLYNDSAATILEMEGDWYKITSGTVTGYVKSEYFVTGDEVEELAKTVGTRLATVTTTTLKVREENSLDALVETLVPIGDELTVIKELGDWVQVSIDGDIQGYVSSDYVDLRTEFKEAESIEEEQARLQAEEQARLQDEEEARLQAEEEAKLREEARRAEEVSNADVSRTESNQTHSSSSSSTENSSSTKSASSNVSTYSSSKHSSVSQSSSTSSIRQNIVNYALRFVGNPYVWGGTSLTNGADCSGFTQSVFRDNGISIPRNSRSQASAGRYVSISNLQLGDLVFYGSNGTINHVAIYIGNGQVISASNPEYGIRVSAYNYRQPYKAVSYID